MYWSPKEVYYTKQNKHNRRELGMPQFAPEHFQGKRRREQGCWPYALNSKYWKFALVGEFIGKVQKKDATDEELIEAVIEEGKYFGLKIRRVNMNYTPEKDKEYLIYLRRKTSNGNYTFFRQDTSGFWSYKAKGEKPKQLRSFNDVANGINNEKEGTYVGFLFVVKEDR